MFLSFSPKRVKVPNNAFLDVSSSRNHDFLMVNCSASEQFTHWINCSLPKHPRPPQNYFLEFSVLCPPEGPKGMRESTVVELKRIPLFAPKLRGKGVLAHPFWGNGRRDAPQNSFRNVGGHEAIHMKALCHDFGSGEHCSGVEPRFLCSTSFSTRLSCIMRIR